MRFTDRRDAGRRLADELARRWPTGPDPEAVVLGLPRGGIPVAREVADRLGVPLDVLVVRKLGAPGHAELAIGALGERGIRVVDPDSVARLRVSDAYLDRVTADEAAELARRVDRYRGGAAPVPVAGRTAVLIDDGIATGNTVRAAVAVLRKQGAQTIVVAVPVASSQAVRMLEAEVDTVVVLHVPHDLRAVGLYYQDFTPTTDDEVVAALAADRTA